VPAGIKDSPDIGLYDLAKTTAAFAVCLSEKDLKEQPFLFVGADVSGIQSYLYDIVSKNASKNLKGRSFYLQMLIESILEKMTQDLGLYDANVVYSSGGGFYLIAPNTELNIGRLKKLKKDIEEKIFARHGTSLYVAIACHVFSRADLMDDAKMKDLWKGLGEKLNQQKRQRYKDMMLTEDGYKKFFEPPDDIDMQRRDVITGEEFGDSDKNEKNEIEYIVFPLIDNSLEKNIKKEKELLPDEDYIKKYTYQQIELGKDLKKAKYWVVHKHKDGFSGSFDVCGLEVHHALVEGDKKVPDGARKYKLNELDGSPFRFYGGNKYPTRTKLEEGDSEDDKKLPKDFNELADGEGSFKRLGVLRMDVDSLGQLFIRGFKGRNLFVRYSCLSRNLDYFFKGYLNTIWAKEDYRELSYIIYSGGDDLFIVGRWDKLIHMAKDIHGSFKEWSCGQASLSGGIAIVPGKFPILKAAVLAGDAEEQAKSYEYNGREKNAFSLLGYPLGWAIDFGEVEKLKNEIKEKLENDDLPKSLNTRIYAYHSMSGLDHEKEKYEVENLKVLWMSAYDMGRMKSRYKDSKAFLSELQTGIFSNSLENGKKDKKYHYLDMLYVASRWAELEIRTEE
jgi:CRISPR-associated protein Csm1